jgi:aminoglycoside phosphotransferase (APT) family kinase protein
MTDHSSNARVVLRTFWNIDSEPVKVDIGVNKETWRVGAYWLNAEPIDQLHRIERELSLLDLLSATPDLPFCLPLVVPNRFEELPIHFEQVWRLSEHVDGRAPIVNSVDDLDAVTRGIARLHIWSSHLSPISTPTELDSYGYFQNAVSLLENEVLPLSRLDRISLTEGEEFVNSKFKAFQQNRQLVHGDPSYPNLRVMENQGVSLTGLIDWESSRVDSTISDLAVLGQTVVFRFQSKQTLINLLRILDVYAQASGTEFQLQELFTAMVLGKFESIFHHGCRFLQGRAEASMVSSQASKIAAILTLKDFAANQ